MKRHFFLIKLTTLSLLVMVFNLFLFNLIPGKKSFNPINPQTIFSLNPVYGQNLPPEKVSEQVYRKIPDLPLANEYVSRENNQVASENTFITRLVRYHQFTKSRPMVFRLDWKLTLADYLGKNEIMEENRYPSSFTLTTNPFFGDRKIIQGLTPQQRDNLVNVLVEIYNPSPSNKVTSPPPQETDSVTPPGFVLPQQGGADLLMK